MIFINWICVLALSFLSADGLSARAMRFPEDPDCGNRTFVPRVKPKTVNMIEFMVPNQRSTDALQYHLSGYMECLGGECKKNGEPAHYDGGFSKVVQVAANEQGDVRYINTKGPGGHPNEYFVVKNEVDECGREIQVAYLEWETMDWAENQCARGYHNRMTGYPTFEWGRSNVVSGAWNPQNPGFEQYIFCGAKPETISPMMETGYIVRTFKLSEDLESVNKAMGSLGPVEPKWLDIAKELGRDPEIMVIAGNWGYNGYTPGPEQWKWTYRELYFYLKGGDFLSWRWQEHIGGNLSKDFETLKRGNQTTVVWGKDPPPPLELCAKVPR